MAKLYDIMATMDHFAPPSLAEEWDNVGLQMGHPDQEVGKVLLALTATEDVIAEAIEEGADLLLTHHPLIFSGPKSLRRDRPQGRILTRMIKADLAHFCAHTNLDVAPGGVNDVLGGLLGLENLRPLSRSGGKKTYKLIVFVPLEGLPSLEQALFSAGAGRQGLYAECSWQVLGTGSFRPLEGAQPALGQVGTRHQEEEVRLELLVDEDDLAEVQKALKESHPYEEVAYDLFEEVHMGRSYGLGRLGDLPSPRPLKDLLAQWSQALGVPLRVSGDPEMMVAQVGLCGGSGQSLLGQAVKAGCQAYLTGDVRYHGFQEADEEGIALIDASHYGTEAPVLRHLGDLLSQAHPGLKCQVSRVEANLYQVFP